MKFGDEHLRRFKLGDTVRIKRNLQIGRKYFTNGEKGDLFTSRMSNNLGKEGRVIEITYIGYRLDIDPIHTYTEEMLELPTDTLAESEYTFNEDVETVLEHSKMLYYQNKIDDALDNRLFETDLESFERLVKQYTEIFDKINKR